MIPLKAKPAQLTRVGTRLDIIHVIDLVLKVFSFLFFYGDSHTKIELCVFFFFAQRPLV